MKNSNSLSILFWANKSKADANGQIPLYARVTMSGKRAEISLNLKVDPNRWDSKTRFVKGNTPESKRVNAEMVNVKNAIQQAHDELKRTEEFITAEKIKLKYFGEVKPQRMLLEVFDDHNQNLKDLIGKDVVKATHTSMKPFAGRYPISSSTSIKNKIYTSSLLNILLLPILSII